MINEEFEKWWDSWYHSVLRKIGLVNKIKRKKKLQKETIK